MTNRKIKGGSGVPRAAPSYSPIEALGLRGGTRKRRTHHKRRTQRKRRKGGSLLATAALPFGLFGLQKLFQKRRTRRQVRRVGKAIKKDLRKLNVRRLLKK